jgi:hypothetical protein
MKYFDNAHGIQVPRTRFIPVKTCSDLLLSKSDIYTLQDDKLVPNPDRMFTTIPVIKLGDHYRKVRLFVTCLAAEMDVGGTADSGVPGALQADPENRGAGPLDGDGRRPLGP